jgi:energy-coupling factor transporter ATP-binding protein EcfA2
MFLLSYRYRDNDEGKGWDISNISFTKNNLFVGVSGSGKSRMLNSLMNIGTFISQNIFRDGLWEIEFKINGSTYKWFLHSIAKNGEQIILSEKLLLCVNGAEDQFIFNRDKDNFEFNGSKLPKLPKNSTGIYLLREEDAVKPVYDGFGRILRRNFFGADLVEACAIANVPPELLDKKFYKNSIGNLGFSAINPRLHLLQLHEKDSFDTIVEEYKSIFPSIQNITFVDGSKLAGNSGLYPVLALKEKGIDHPIMLHDLSSGMQKVLLIITDIITLPNHSIYIIDEYENSLGVNAINFLPEFIVSYGKDSQFITTSHHPYLINNIPISDWKIFSRLGSTVSVKGGDKLKEKYSKSKQDSFIQLMNDPAYTGS